MTTKQPTPPTGTAGTFSPAIPETCLPGEGISSSLLHCGPAVVPGPPAFRSRVRVRDGGTGVSRTPGGPLARTHKQQAGGPGGAALEQEKKV